MTTVCWSAPIRSEPDSVASEPDMFDDEEQEGEDADDGPTMFIVPELLLLPSLGDNCGT